MSELLEMILIALACPLVAPLMIEIQKDSEQEGENKFQ